jgi:predicted DNA-binding protein
MAIQKSETSVTLDEATASALRLLAKRDGKSVSILVNELIHDAIERNEDLYFSKL